MSREDLRVEREIRSPDSSETDPAAEWWKRIFAAADSSADLEPLERDAYVSQCGIDDPALAAELKLLFADADSASTLDKPAVEFAAAIFDAARERSPASPQSQFGPYRIIREIGHGGMGAVYAAERSDDQYRKLVALKILPAWSAGDDRKIQRFVDERQILAALDHPNIARLLDGGITADGLPWFAMELVDGVRIDRYCDELRLSTEERLDLFCQVCGAVQYAHRNLVVHRDLKPANILVTPERRVRLLDFGIAKLLGENLTASDLTLTGERLLTPLYASPEQIRGNTISTASDIYTLGVLLNVLLTGRPPYELATREPHEVARAILESEPTPPSAMILRCESSAEAEAIAAARRTSAAKLHRRIEGDLDAIVMKAIEKDPPRRYSTAEQLEADVRKHLEGQPVVARRPSRLYLARKFVRRHRGGVAMAVAVSALVITSAVVASVQASRIRAQAESIALERDRAKAVSTFFNTLFLNAVPGRPGRGVTSREILDSAAARIDERRVPDPAQRAQLMFEMARVYHRLDLNETAHTLLVKSLAITRNAAGTRPGELVESLNLFGSVLKAMGSTGKAETTYREALALSRADAPQGSQQSRSLIGLASVLRSQRRLTEAEALSREAIAIGRARRRDPISDLDQSMSGLGRILLDKGDHRAGAELFRQALAVLRETRPEENAEIAGAIFELAGALKISGEHAQADSLTRYALGIYHRLLAVAALGGASDLSALSASPAAQEIAAPVERALAGSNGGLVSMHAETATSSSLIVFTSDRDGPDPIGDLGNQEIYVMNADGSNQRRITNHPAIDSEGTWSPDGRRIAFTSRREGGFEIFLVNKDGTGLKRLTRMTESAREAGQPSWSPDGKRIAFRSRSPMDIYVIGVDGTGLTRLTDDAARDHGPAWSPDGTRIAFASDRDGPPQIYIMQADGTAIVRVTRSSGKDHRPSWSPDGKRIAFHSDRSGRHEIYVINADGSHEVRLTSRTIEDGRATWSPDGQRILFHRRVLGHGQLFTMKSDGSDQKRLTEISATSFNAFASWGPVIR